jgi:uncharacterized protein (DUF58 family)
MAASPPTPGPGAPPVARLHIDPAQLARLGSLTIQARVIVEGALSGLHRAAVHGSSVEFAEHKEYSPGDELRHVDWKAYAKLDRYYVKQFEQESQLSVYLVLDASASMAFAGGGIAKLQYGGLVLAALAYLVIQQQDKVGLLACGDPTLETLVPPRARTTHLHDLMAVLESVIARGGTGDEPPASALARIAELTRRRRALIVLVSDLFDPGDKTLQMLVQLRAQRHDVSVVHLLDPHERQFPYDGLTQFEALETANKVLVNPAAIRQDYLERMEAFLAKVRNTLTGAGVDYHLAQTDQPLEQTLLNLLVARSRLGPARRAR